MLFELYDRLFPEDDPRSKRRWRATVGSSIFLLGGFAIFTTTALLFDLPKIGSIAWAGDVDKKIDAAVKPINSKLETLETSMDTTAKATKNLLAKVAADQIDQLVRRRCRSSDPDEIAYLSREIRRYQDDYRMNRPNGYETPTCEEVGYKEKTR